MNVFVSLEKDKKNVVLIDRPTRIIDRQIVDRNDCMPI